MLKVVYLHDLWDSETEIVDQVEEAEDLDPGLLLEINQDLVTEIVVLLKCTKQFVTIVVMSVKYLLDQPAVNLYTAAIVLKAKEAQIQEEMKEETLTDLALKDHILPSLLIPGLNNNLMH